MPILRLPNGSGVCARVLPAAELRKTDLLENIDEQGVAYITTMIIRLECGELNKINSYSRIANQDLWCPIPPVSSQK